MKNNDLKKKFVSGGIGITREFYESMPCAMYAMEFTNAQMQELVDKIANVLSSQYGYNEHEIFCLKEDSQEFEDFYKAFWIEMEKIALNMGMRYYDDMSEKEYMKIIKKRKRNL